MLIEIYLFVCGCGGLNAMSKQEEQKNEQRQIACEHRLSQARLHRRQMHSIFSKRWNELGFQFAFISISRHATRTSFSKSFPLSAV
jgi:hypothetical protein